MHFTYRGCSILFDSLTFALALCIVCKYIYTSTVVNDIWIFSRFLHPIRRVVTLPLADVVPSKECVVLLPENAHFTKPWLNE